MADDQRMYWKAISNGPAVCDENTRGDLGDCLQQAFDGVSD